jgi:predicted phosphodiesterase
MDLEWQARRLLDQEPEVKTVIFGHTHKPMNKAYADGKQYINTGTWTKMVNLDFRSLGQQQFNLTFALIKIREGQSQCELRSWVGEYSPHRVFQA